MAMSTEELKAETLRLYRMLPQNMEERKKRIDIRDKIIELNYAFFGYLAKKTFINNTSITYEDKLQSALCHFCECWTWYQWDGDENHRGYRKDLSFTVFFGPRVGEMMERELNEVKYSTRRSLCMKAGAQLGKHWGQVRYDDLAKLNDPTQLPDPSVLDNPKRIISPEEMNSLKAIFGSFYWADLETQELFIEAPSEYQSQFDDPTDKYDSIEEFLMNQMIVRESKLSNADLQELADIHSLNYEELLSKREIAESRLYHELHSSLDMRIDVP